MITRDYRDTKIPFRDFVNFVVWELAVSVADWELE
jgi:hypothetical protein